MSPALEDILRGRRADVAARKAQVPPGALEERLSRAGAPRPFRRALEDGPGPALIAELKAASPSAGLLRRDYNVMAGALAYERGGARALSVLTEPRYFRGDVAHLAQARQATVLPLLRKDFVVDAYQLLEARAWGADAVLLIVRCLDDADLRAALAEAGRLGLEALVEVHDEADMARAAGAGATLIGVNSRNLDTLAVDAGTFERLAARAPKGAFLVAESGLQTPADVRRAGRLGYGAVLVGESLLRQDNLEAAARALAEAGRTTHADQG